MQIESNGGIRRQRFKGLKNYLKFTFVQAWLWCDCVCSPSGRGLAAVKELEGEALSPKFHQLDILSGESIKKLGDFLVEKYGGLDVLVNNAAIKLVGCLWNEFVSLHVNDCCTFSSKHK